MTANYFLLFLALMIVALSVACTAYLGLRRALAVMTGLSVWLAYVGWLSFTGVIADAARRPPGILFIGVPLLVFVVALMRSKASFAGSFPVWVLIGLQTFRVGVEVLIHQLYLDGLVPRLMTWEAGNLDILAGLSAPVVAWLVAAGRIGRRSVLAWNVTGLVLLANIVLRAVLTSPGPLHLLPSEVANRAVGMFPFTFIAGFFAPLALVLHVLTLQTRRKGR